MLRVHLHTGDLGARSPGNQLAVLDIAYAHKTALADYLVGMVARGQGEVEPDYLRRYPRWSGSLWDLTARALTRVLYRADQAPEAPEPDRRCAYATRLCAVVERVTLDGAGVELGWASIAQRGRERGYYTVVLEEDILGQHSGEFAYGSKRLDARDLLLRAINWALFGKPTLGPAPALILPPTLCIDGEDRFHVQALQEPARTGFERYRATSLPAVAVAEPLARAQDYVDFLMQG